MEAKELVIGLERLFMPIQRELQRQTEAMERQADATYAALTEEQRKLVDQRAAVRGLQNRR